jgi:hypothetical protein
VSRDLATLYAPLHDTVLGMVDELAARYEVDRRAATAEELARVEGCASEVVGTTVLVPASPQRSLLIVGRCDMPGVHLAYGRWGLAHLPVCGCDACDESLEEIVDELAKVRRVVTGGFDEWVRREDGRWWLGGRDGYRSLGLDERRALGVAEPVEIAWRPWTLRPG